MLALTHIGLMADPLDRMTGLEASLGGELYESSAHRSATKAHGTGRICL